MATRSAAPGLAAHEVKIALRVRRRQVRVQQDAAMNRKGADRSLDRSAPAIRCPMRLWSNSADLSGVGAEDARTAAHSPVVHEVDVPWAFR